MDHPLPDQSVFRFCLEKGLVPYRILHLEVVLPFLFPDISFGPDLHFRDHVGLMVWIANGIPSSNPGSCIFILTNTELDLEYLVYDLLVLVQRC